jgi:hypothetical protein
VLVVTGAKEEALPASNDSRRRLRIVCMLLFRGGGPVKLRQTEYECQEVGSARFILHITTFGLKKIR